MRQRILACFALLAAALVPVALAGPATATSYGASATGTPVDYVSDNCFTSHITVTGLNPGDDGTEIYVYRPDGSVEDVDFAYGSTIDQFDSLLCRYSDPAGVYTITVGGQYAGQFSVAEPVLTAARSSKRVVVGQLTLRGLPFANQTVTADRRRYGSFSAVRSLVTDGAGLVRLRCAKHRHCPQRYRFTFGDFLSTASFKLTKH